MTDRKIWLVEHPTHQFEEDVKKLARLNDLVIYDAKVGGMLDPNMVEQNPPKLTKKGEKKRKPKAPKVEKPAEEQATTEE
jgi:hypothetical protein